MRHLVILAAAAALQPSFLTPCLLCAAHTFGGAPSRQHPERPLLLAFRGGTTSAADDGVPDGGEEENETGEEAVVATMDAQEEEQQKQQHEDVYAADTPTVATKPKAPAEREAAALVKKKKKKSTRKKKLTASSSAKTRKGKTKVTMLGSLNDGLSKLTTRASSYYEAMKEYTKAAAVAPREAEQCRRATKEVVADDEDADEDVDAEEAYLRRQAAQDEEGMEITLSERGAMLGSILLAPAGIPGVVVGGVFGGAAGYVTERIEQARTYVASAYGERVAAERAVEQQMAAASNELNSLDEVRVRPTSDANTEEAAGLTADFVEFLALPANKKCADCAARLNHHNDAWASVNLGVLVCVNCAAVHRSLGVGVSRMKSVVFDKWDVPTARAMLEAGGNEAARSKYLARLPHGYAEPTATTNAQRRASFIRTKYVRLRWAEPEFREAKRAELEERAAAAAAAEVTRAKHMKGSKGRQAQAFAQGTAMPSLSSESA